MSTLRVDSPVQYVKGVGPQRAAAFATLGIQTVGDLLHYYPFRYEHESGEVAIADLVPGTHATVRGEVLRVGGRRPMLRCEIDDGTGQCILRWFNQDYGGRSLFRGATVIASGRVQIYGDLAELVQPRVQVFAPDAVLMTQGAGPRRVGVYRGNQQCKSPLIRRSVLAVLNQAQLPLAEILPETLVQDRGLLPRAQAVRMLHCPPDEPQLAEARRRLAFEELFLMELAMALRRQRRMSLQQAAVLHVTPEIDARIRARFPFTLTSAQDEVVREIAADLQLGRPMTRLLQGDVGSGKTVVALYACLVAIANGRQAAIMAPTEILAQQHYANIQRYLAGSRVRSVLLRGKLPKGERDAALSAIENGQLDLVVGTQALIQKDVAFNELALVVVDEQHKFGVLQRHEFRTKGLRPHYLVMTATPIPRTLAMTIFGDLEISVLKQSPPGRGNILTKVVPRDKWETVLGYVHGRLLAGEQAYVVCPQIGRSDEPETSTPPAAGQSTRGAARAPEIVTVTDMYTRLSEGPWRDLRIGLLHGALRPADKQRVIRDFTAGALHAVVSTTVVEVGVDIPNASIMLIENADRYGLSQLHQLRGRIGRGARDSLCVLIAADERGQSGERLAAMVASTDGFAIAEADLKQRGPGEFFGTRQHGLPELRVANIVEDFALLEAARTDAFALVKRDPELRAPEHELLRAALRALFRDKLALIDAA
ncbi:MAG: ATP-dependent DNA helicase RecG [Phycisphaerales bacterium]|nr:ATP-dependent DNA helicase RecG [Phycisphaerales bacterium]